MSTTPRILSGNAAIGQSGGPTVVINQSLAGVVETLRGREGIGKIFGCEYAVRGILTERFIELQDITPERLERIALTPSAALGSSRDKPDSDYCRRIFQHFAKHDIRYFFYIGGNDSSDTCRIVSEMARADGYELRCFHVPKTIDNDLANNDHTPGFGSAAKFVAQAFMGDNLDNAALPGIKIDVVMGRNAGFLTAASVLARQHAQDGPHLIYVPEIAFHAEKFILDVERIYKEQGRCMIAVSEGIHDADGVSMATKAAGRVERDAHGNVQLSGSGALGDFLSDSIRNHMGPKTRVRVDTFGYLQRSFAGCTSPVDAEEAREVGRRAAQAALAGRLEGSVTIQRVSDKPYRVEYVLKPLAEVAGKTRTLPREFLIDDNNIADSYKDYLLPLVGPLPVIELLLKSN
jgi:6-phosphofructokinase 1